MAVEDLVNRVSGGCTRGGARSHSRWRRVLVEPEIAGSCPPCSVCADGNAITTLPITSGVIIDGPRSAADRMWSRRLGGVPWSLACATRAAPRSRSLRGAGAAVGQKRGRRSEHPVIQAAHRWARPL